MVTKYSFRHNLTSASKQKTSSTKVVKEYAHIKEIQCIPQNIDSNGKKMLISDDKGALYPSSAC